MTIHAPTGRPVLFLLAAGIVASCASTEQRGDRAPTLEEAATLRVELLERAERDQEIRSRVVAAFERGETPRVSEEDSRIDRENTARLEEIVDRWGWPDVSLVGEDGAHAAWLLVQHADHRPDFQERCLPLLAEAAERGQVSKGDVAYLTDRVRVKLGRPQVYGTQYAGERTEGGTFVSLPPLVEDVEGLDVRRAAVGLGPWIEYERSMARLQGREPFDRPRSASE